MECGVRGRNGFRWGAVLLTLSALAPVNRLTPSPLAKEAGDERLYAIPAQPLAQALTIFARESGVDIFYETGLANGRRSAPIKGRYDVALALRLMLEGTGLQARFTDRQSAYVYLPSSSQISEAAAGRPSSTSASPTLRLDMAEVRAPRMIGSVGPSFDAYANQAVREIRAILNVGGGLKGTNFNVAILVRLDSSGQIETVGLASESRDRRPEREAEIRNRLVGHKLSQPPPEGFISPFRFEIRPARTARQK